MPDAQMKYRKMNCSLKIKNSQFLERLSFLFCCLYFTFILFSSDQTDFRKLVVQLTSNSSLTVLAYYTEIIGHVVTAANSKAVFGTLSNIYGAVFAKIVNGFQPLTIDINY